MNHELIRAEILKVQQSSFATKTDKQLESYELLSQQYKEKNEGKQPPQLVKYNQSVNRKCKLTVELVAEIRIKYNPYVYGKSKLAKEYGVSASVILRIIKGKAWKVIDDS